MAGERGRRVEEEILVAGMVVSEAGGERCAGGDGARGGVQEDGLEVGFGGCPGGC